MCKPERFLSVPDVRTQRSTRRLQKAILCCFASVILTYQIYNIQHDLRSLFLFCGDSAGFYCHIAVCLHKGKKQKAAQCCSDAYSCCLWG